MTQIPDIPVAGRLRHRWAAWLGLALLRWAYIEVQTNNKASRTPVLRMIRGGL